MEGIKEVSVHWWKRRNVTSHGSTFKKVKWWGAIRERQTVSLLRSKNIMFHHDGYGEKDLMLDLENKKNVELSFDDILSINHKEKVWGSILNVEYVKNGKKEKHQYAIAQDWVKYPAKEPMKYMKVDWEPFVQYIKDNQKLIP